jgi:flagellar secretion chaperone FliS
MIDAKTNYAAASATGVTPLGLVVRLYETVISDLGRAVIAIRDADTERRTFELQHALAVIGHLQGSLDMDKGEEPAKVLDRFYDMARARILQAQVRHSGKILEEVIKDFLLLRDAWADVEQQLAQPQVEQPKQTPSETPRESSSSTWVA